GAALGFIEELRSCNALFNEAVDAFQLRFISPKLGVGAIELGLCPVDLFGPGATFKFRQACLSRIVSGAGLIELSAVFAVFEPNNDLFLTNTVTLLDTDPCHTPGDLRSDLDFVMGDNVAGCNQYCRLGRTFGTRPDRLDCCGGCRAPEIEQGQ